MGKEECGPKDKEEGGPKGTGGRRPRERVSHGLTMTIALLHNTCIHDPNACCSLWPCLVTKKSHLKLLLCPRLEWPSK